MFRSCTELRKEYVSNAAIALRIAWHLMALIIQKFRASILKQKLCVKNSQVVVINS